MQIVTTRNNSVEATMPTWRSEMRNAFRTQKSLLEYLGIAHEGGLAESLSFPIFVPESFAKRMVPGDLDDPLLRQVLYDLAEEESFEGDSVDAVGDSAATKSPGILQKYAGRVLLVLTGACAVHCRYCFRRHFDYDAVPHGAAEWSEALTRIDADKSINEVILSGGDPLTLVDSTLQEIIERIERIPHVTTLRIHTRLPIVLPRRVTSELCDILVRFRKSKVVVLHANHPRELNEEVSQALNLLRGAEVTLLNQTVLLNRVNDNLETLVELSRMLWRAGVLPYYLHQLDRVKGVRHFEVDEATGRELVRQMEQQLPGYLVPRYVREVAGDFSKRRIV